jgi:hypothetical protein
MPRFELQTKLPPSCCGAVRGHTVEGRADFVVGVVAAGDDVVVVGGTADGDDDVAEGFMAVGEVDVVAGGMTAADVAAGGTAAGEVDVAGVVAVVVQDASRTTVNKIRQMRLNLPLRLNSLLNNFFMLYSLSKLFFSSCQYPVYYLVQLLS